MLAQVAPTLQQGWRCRRAPPPGCSESEELIDDLNSETRLTRLVSHLLKQRLAKMATVHQQAIDELAARLLENAVSEWEDLDQTSWTVTLFETEDGSGDAILAIPDELLAAAGWVEGDTLSL